MTDSTDPRDRIKLEVYRLQREIHACAHCDALRDQIVRLLNVLPPAPLVFKGRIDELAWNAGSEWKPLPAREPSQCPDCGFTTFDRDAMFSHCCQ